MEVIMACENVCRDFHWLPVVAQTIGGLSTLGALIIAWVAYRNWRRPKVADRVSSVASDFLGELKDFEVTLMAARMRPDWPDAFDYEKAKRLLGDATQIRARLQAKAELIGALLSDEALSEAVSDLLFILRTVQQEVQ